MFSKFLAGAAICLFPVVASAADLSARAPAPLSPVSSAPLWQSGVYAGLNVGGAFGASKQSLPDGYWEGDDSYGSIKGNKTAVIGGAQLGVNYVTGNLLFGAEVDASGLNFRTMHAEYPYDGAAVGQKVNTLITARLRSGLIFGQTLAYVTGGLAVTSGNVTLMDDSDHADSKTNLWAPGWVVGAGVEHALGGLFDGGAVFVAEWLASEAGPGVVVVDDGVGVAEITFQSSACEAHEGVVHGAGHDAEVKQRCRRNNQCCITGNF